MKLVNEDARSYIDDPRYIELIKFLTWKGDLAPTWIGMYMPATRAPDAELVDNARFNRDHYLFYRALVEKHVEKRGRILDLGCGTGQRTAMLSRYAEYVCGMDNDMLKISAASNLPHKASGIEWVWGDIASYNTAMPRNFDYIFCVEVVEHIELDGQQQFIDQCIDVLAPGGKLFLTTPRDKAIQRVAPHIGLWDDAIAEQLMSEHSSEMSYFNVNQLRDGGENPWCGRDDATHYVVIVAAP